MKKPLLNSSIYWKKLYCGYFLQCQVTAIPDSICCEPNSTSKDARKYIDRDGQKIRGRSGETCRPTESEFWVKQARNTTDQVDW